MADMEDIRKLAVSYDAYREFSDKQDYTRVLVYGGMLNRAQLATGVEIVPYDTLQARLAFARAHEKEPVKTEVQRAATVVADNINSLREIIYKEMSLARGNGLDYADLMFYVLTQVAK